MPGHPATIGLLLLAAVTLGLGGLGVAGVVSFATTGTAGQGPIAAFSWNTAGMNVTVLAQNVIPSSVSGIGPGVTGPSWTSTIRWGDGTAQVIGSNSVTHGYTSAGSYTLQEILQGHVAGALSVTTLAVSTVVRVPGTAAGTVATGSPGGNAYISPSFRSATSVLNVSVADTSQAFNETILGVTFAWGDGGRTANLSAGSTASHIYQASGTYTITETVYGGAFLPGSSPSSGTSAAPTLVPGVYVVNTTVTVQRSAPNPCAQASAGCGPDTNPALNAGQSGGFSPAADALLLFGTLSAIGALLAYADPKVGVLVGLVGGTAVGAVAYLAAAGVL